MRRNWLHFLLIGTLTVVLLAISSCKSADTDLRDDDPCGDPDCEVTELILNTGYNQATGQLYQPVTLDPYWQLVTSPNTGLVLPTPAYVISQNPAWETLPGSQWISAYDYSNFTTNNPPPGEPYTLERCFCVCEKTELIIDLDFLADDWAKVYLDSIELGESLVPATASANQTIWNTRNPKHIAETIAVEAGVHCIRAEVRNTNGVAMGFNMVGTVTSASGEALFLKDDCCDPTCAIMGRKINDINCNGEDDNPSNNGDAEPGLVGWTIEAVNTDTGQIHTTQTDANGYYCFNNLDPGIYIVSEVLQADWLQTIPQSGTYTVTLEANQALQLDFGNCMREQPCAIIDNEVIDCGEPGAAGPTYTYTFDVTNVSDMTAYYMLLTPSGDNLNITPDSPIPLDPPLSGFDTTTVTVTLIGAQPEDCFTLTLIGIDPLTQDGYCIDDIRDIDDDCCCSIEVCLPELPDCSGCVEFYEEAIELLPSLPGIWTFEYTFCLTNLTNYPVDHIYFYLPDDVTIQVPQTPLSNYIHVSLSPSDPQSTDDTFCGTATITITSATPGTQLKFGISLHDEELKYCCVTSHTINLSY